MVRNVGWKFILWKLNESEDVVDLYLKLGERVGEDLAEEREREGG